MEPSLDHPPVIIRTPRGRLAIGLAVSACLAILTLWAPQTLVQVKFGVWAFMLLFAGALATAPRLVISQQGLLHASLLEKRSWSWSDFDRFEIFRLPILGIASPGCRFSESYLRKIQPIPDPSVDRSKGALGVLWELPAPEVVQLLNEARERWTAPP